jgi:hypothetical protein
MNALESDKIAPKQIKLKACPYKTRTATGS